MRIGQIIHKPRYRKNHAYTNPTRTIALVFLLIILCGALLLMLPFSSRDGKSCGVLPALFTATSSTCVTGLVLYDTWTQWSAFGQGIILILIETGGLGFISMASFVIFVLRKKVGLKQRMVIAQAFSLDEMEGVVKLQKRVIGGSVAIQLTGAAVLIARLWPQYGMKRAMIWGVFHSVSAFCNAGFDILGSIAPGASMAPFQSDPIVCITLMFLIVLGGLGFFVWEELATKRSLRKCSIYTKLVLIASSGLILLGAGLTMLLEWNNPQTLGNMPVGTKILNAFFQSVTLRTAGFASFDQGGLTEGGKAVSVLFMLIGGSSGSTAGGIKTVTVLVLILFLYARIRGRRDVTVFRRTVPGEKVVDALTLTTLVALLAVLGAVFLCVANPVSFLDALYETSSAIGTVGLTTGLTPGLGVASQILIIVFMYFGRVGLLTLSVGFLMGDRAQERYRYAYTNILIG